MGAASANLCKIAANAAGTAAAARILSDAHELRKSMRAASPIPTDLPTAW